MTSKQNKQLDQQTDTNSSVQPFLGLSTLQQTMKVIPAMQEGKHDMLVQTHALCYTDPVAPHPRSIYAHTDTHLGRSMADIRCLGLRRSRSGSRNRVNWKSGPLQGVWSSVHPFLMMKHFTSPCGRGAAFLGEACTCMASVMLSGCHFAESVHDGSWMLAALMEPWQEHIQLDKYQCDAGQGSLD